MVKPVINRKFGSIIFGSGQGLMILLVSAVIENIVHIIVSHTAL